MATVPGREQRSENAGFAVPDAAMAEHLASMRQIAVSEIAGVPTESAEAAARYVVLVSVLVERLLYALRRPGNRSVPG